MNESWRGELPVGGEDGEVGHVHEVVAVEIAGTAGRDGLLPVAGKDGEVGDVDLAVAVHVTGEDFQVVEEVAAGGSVAGLGADVIGPFAIEWVI